MMTAPGTPAGLAIVRAMVTWRSRKGAKERRADGEREVKRDVGNVQVEMKLWQAEQANCASVRLRSLVCLCSPRCTLTVGGIMSNAEIRFVVIV